MPLRATRRNDLDPLRGSGVVRRPRPLEQQLIPRLKAKYWLQLSGRIREAAVVPIVGECDRQRLAGVQDLQIHDRGYHHGSHGEGRTPQNLR